MQALLCHKYGGPKTLKFEEVKSLRPKKNQVIIKVHACSVNFPDTLMIRGKYQFKPEFPFSPGSEVSGEIIKVGAGVSNFKEGMRVLSIPGWGGMAEQVAVEANRVVSIPDNMTYTDAASFLYTYGTVYHALVNRARIKRGETLLVLGAAGGIGTATIDIAKQLGAVVIAAASNKIKLAVCKDFGAEHLIDYTKEDIKEKVKEITKGKGVDVVLDPVGDKYAEPAFRSIAWKGRYLVVGFAGGKIPKIPLNLPLLKGASIMGVFWGKFIQTEAGQNFSNVVQLMTWYNEGKLTPYIYKVYDFSEAKQALLDMDQRKIVGKAVVKVV